MGIFCEINLFKPSDGAFQPGQLVSGLIRYAVDEPMEIDKITTSLKGTGQVTIKVKRGNKKKRTIYNSIENYVDIDNVIQDTKTEIQVGSSEVKFSFILPYDIPSTLNIRKYSGRYNASCEIKYYIRIKFERPGFFTFNKHFRKEITVITGGTPRLSRDPIMYGELKKLTKFFSSKENIVQIKATILNSVITFGGKIEILYEVENNSTVLVKSLKTKLVEIYKFHAAGYHEIEFEENIPDTDSKTTSIACGNTQNSPVEINVPSDIHSLENANIVSRDYFFRIIAELPMPHRDVVLNIPVQIGAADSHSEQNRLEGIDEDFTFNDPPPSYWEAMGEAKKDDKTEDDIEDEK